MVESVIDSVVINHFLRKSSPRGKRKSQKELVPLVAIENAFKKRRLLVVVDKPRGIISEWEQTCGVEGVKQLVIKWTDLSGFRLVQPAGLPAHAAKKLRKLGFNDVIDKLIVRCALRNGVHTTIVSIDSDFWDPSNPHRVGYANTPVAAFLRKSFGLTVQITSTFLASLRAA